MIQKSCDLNFVSSFSISLIVCIFCVLQMGSEWGWIFRLLAHSSRLHIKVRTVFTTSKIINKIKKMYGKGKLLIPVQCRHTKFFLCMILSEINQCAETFSSCENKLIPWLMAGINVTRRPDIYHRCDPLDIKITASEIGTLLYDYEVWDAKCIFHHNFLSFTQLSLAIYRINTSIWPQVKRYS